MSSGGNNSFSCFSLWKD